jgi:predicted amidohydrolase YtcJ
MLRNHWSATTAPLARRAARLRSWCAALAGLAIASCASPTATTAEKPSVLLTGPRFYLGYPDWEAVQALLVQDGKVVRAGSIDELQRAAPHARRVDLGPGFAVPGLQDAHGHVEGLGASLEELDLRGARSFDEVIARIADRARELPAGTWIEGRGWDQNLWPDKSFPNHAALSERVPKHPVWVRRVDGHAALANAAALAAAGLDRPITNADAVQGGEVLTDDQGRPTGVFVDAAMALVRDHIPKPDDATRERRLLLAHDALLAAGLTAVHDMGVDAWTVHTIQRLRDAGRWKLRTVMYLSMGPQTDPAELDGFPLAPDARDVVAVPGVKLYIDGALGSRGAALLEDYSDRPGYRGLLLMEPAKLEELVELCAQKGLQPAVHAIGDRGNRAVLDAYEKAEAAHPEFKALRPRIEHAQVVSPYDWPRFERLGVVPSMQPTHCTSDMPWAPARLGDERTRGAYAWRFLAPKPAVLALGSDFPVERPDPLEGLYAARTRQDAAGSPPGGFFPDQRLDAKEALTGFTWGAARACGQEERHGRLQPGYAADLTVLSVDPLRCAPADLLTARALRTVIQGEVAFPSGGF